jgi:hypothetical protein
MVGSRTGGTAFDNSQCAVNVALSVVFESFDDSTS